MSTKYRLIKKIGHGAFSKVFYAKSLSTGDIVCVKIFKDPFDIKYAEREYSNMKMIGDTQNCVRVLDFVNSDELLGLIRNYKRRPCIVMECYDTNLYNYMREIKELSKFQIRFMFKQLLNALQIIHSKNLIHCDLKPSNILLHKSSLRVVVADFGNSLFLSEAEQVKNEFHTTENYRAPERYHKKEFDEKIDIYALGAIIYFLETREHLFEPCEDIDEGIEERKIYEERIIFDISDAILRDLLLRMLHPDPKKRYSVLQCQEHPYFITNTLLQSPRPVSKKRKRLKELTTQSKKRKIVFSIVPRGRIYLSPKEECFRFNKLFD